MMLKFARFDRAGASRGSNEGGVFTRDDGSKWYLKYPTSERQGHNEIMASRFYDAMDFDAVQYHPVDNGMVGARWREDLPSQSDPEALHNSTTVQEAFLPSALIANWDVIGLVYDNCLYDPEEMSEPVFLDFGGSFDTRAMGGPKPFKSDEVMALDGFTDPSINQSAAQVFGGMTPSLFESSQSRVGSLTNSEIKDAVETVGLDSPDTRVDNLQSRTNILLNTDYDDVF